MPDILQIQNLIKSFRTPEGVLQEVVHIERYVLREGEAAALSGESGSGKTTFLNLLAGILRPDAGTIRLAGTDLSSLREDQRDLLRARSLGYIFQTFNLMQGYTALENVELGMAFGAGIDKRFASELLDRVGLSQRRTYYPRQMSVGQQQRVAIARALANRPKLVLADEPTGHLDPIRAAESLDLVLNLCREAGAALLLVSHDPMVLSKFQRVEDLASVNRRVQTAVPGEVSR